MGGGRTHQHGSQNMRLMHALVVTFLSSISFLLLVWCCVFLHLLACLRLLLMVDNNHQITTIGHNTKGFKSSEILPLTGNAGMVHVSERAASVESFKVMDVLQRANELQSSGHKVLHCEVGQPASGAPKTVAHAASEACLNSVMGYTDSFGLLELRSKISQHYKDQYGVAPPSNKQIVVTTGSSGAFLLAFTACFDPGDVVAIASSGYPCYRNILSALGITLCHIGVNEHFKLTAHELQQEIDRRKEKNLPSIKGLILSSPSNPTGAMLSPEELKQLCELCDGSNIQFLSDEIYHGISYGTEEATALQYSQNVVIINSFSKYYSMSGWRLGWMVIPENLIDPINSLQQNMFINAPTVSQTAALHCWDEDSIAELEMHVEKYRQNRTHILEQLHGIPEIDPNNIAPADGGFYVYVDLGEENTAESLGSVRMCQEFLEEKHVAFTPGTDFEDPSTNLGDRRFRISYSQGIDVVQEAMERFHDFWPTWIERVRAQKETA